MNIKTCEFCGLTFEKPYLLHQNKFDKQQCCSNACARSWFSKKKSEYYLQIAKQYPDIELAAKAMNLTVDSARIRLYHYGIKLYKTGGPFIDKYEIPTLEWLKTSGVNVARTPINSHHDAEANGKKLELKTSTFKQTRWMFNIARDGILNESGVDFYVLRLQQYPITNSDVYLILPAPLRAKSFKVSPRTLVTKWFRFINNVTPLLP